MNPLKEESVHCTKTITVVLNLLFENVTLIVYMLSLKNKNKNKKEPLSSGSTSPSAVQDPNHSLYLGTQETQRLHSPGSKDDIMHLAISLQNQRERFIKSECYV